MTEREKACFIAGIACWNFDIAEMIRVKEGISAEWMAEVGVECYEQFAPKVEQDENHDNLNDKP